MVLVLLFLSAASRRRFAIMLSRSHCCLDTRGSRLFCHPERARASSSEGDGEPFFFSLVVLGVILRSPDELHRDDEGPRLDVLAFCRCIGLRRPFFLSSYLFADYRECASRSRGCSLVVARDQNARNQCARCVTARAFYQDGKRVFWDVHQPERTIVIELHAEQYNQLAWATRYKSHLVMRCHHPVTIC